MTKTTVLIIDTETSGLPPDGKVIEVGAIFYRVGLGVINQLSFLLPGDENPAEKINGISPAAMRSADPDEVSMFCEIVERWGGAADYVTAHNAEFDREMLERSPIDIRSQWLCTCYDFTWPKQTKSGDNLVSLALAHGIGVSSAHRALTDCQLLAALFDRVGDALPGLIEKAAMPRRWYYAAVSYENRQLAKDAGFRWDRPSKRWIKRLSDDELKELLSEAEFPVFEVPHEF